MITNLLNNQTIVTGGYEQNSRSSYTLDANGNVKNPRLYQFSRILRSITPGVPTACSRYLTDSKEQFLFNIKNEEQSCFSITIKERTMKKIKFIALAFLALTLGSCMGDGYADPDLTEKVPASPWGNNSLREKNVISIADLKTQFATVIQQRQWLQAD